MERSLADKQAIAGTALLTLQMAAAGGDPRKCFSERHKVEPIPSLEFAFADVVLLPVVFGAEADDPSIRWLESHAAVRAAADVSAFDGQFEAAGHAAVMAPHPRAVCGT